MSKQETEQTGSPYLTPTYQSELISQRHAVLERLNIGDYEGAYRCMEVLLNILTPKVYHLVIADWNKLTAALNSANSIKKADYYTTRHHRIQSKINIIKNRLMPLLRKITWSLKEGGYLEKEQGTNYQNKKPAPIGQEMFNAKPTA